MANIGYRGLTQAGDARDACSLQWHDQHIAEVWIGSCPDPAERSYKVSMRPQSGRRRCAARMNARGNSQSRALAIHPQVRTALTPAVGSDFAKVLSKLPPEELERCSELSATSAQGQCQGSSEPQPSVAPSLSPVRVSMDCLIKVTVCTRPFRTDGPRHNSSGL